MSSITGVDAGQNLNLPNRFNDLSSEDFLKIMFTELSNQDPLKPQDSKAILEQISSIRSIESDIRLVDQLEQLVGQSRFAAAGTLVGKTVTGLDENFFQAEGRVTSVSLEGENIMLTLDSGARVPFEHIEKISETLDGSV